MNTGKLIYRPEIDGLRALAVLSVIFFHANFQFFGGGYVGVDVFFVISGFLITSIILKEIRANKFSFRAFWLRRARRILPALYVVIFFTLAAFAFLFSADQYARLAKSAIGQLLFASNMVFAREAGYFDNASITKPLLHTWSLAIEEQFYLFFPALLVFLNWRFANSYKKLLWGLFVITLLLSCYLTPLYRTDSFYLLHTRVWELGIGCLLAIYLISGVKKQSNLFSELVAALGLACILLSVFIFTKNTIFPSYNALLPCAGAAFFIYANGYNKTISGRLLSAKPVVFVGLISYSLYLWHWVLLVANNAIHVNSPVNMASVIEVLGLAFILAALSYKYIEIPFRKNKHLFPDRKFVIICIGGFVVLMGGAYGIYESEGWEKRLDSKVQEKYEIAVKRPPKREKCHSAFETNPQDFICRSDLYDARRPTKLLVWGDSHADAIIPTLEKAAKEVGLQFEFATHSACLPVPNVILESETNSKSCKAFNKAMQDYAVKKDFDTVLIVARFKYYVEGWHELENAEQNPSAQRISRVDFAEEFSKMVKYLNSKGIAVYVINQVPSMDIDVPEYYIRNSLPLFGDKPFTHNISRRTHDRLSRDMVEYFRSTNVNFVDLTNYFCDAEYCYSTKDGQLLYRDENHMSNYAGMLALPEIEKMFRQIKQGVKP